MRTGDSYSSHTVPLLFPEPIWREWNMNGVGADALAELHAEYATLAGYEFEWGQLIEEAFDADLAADSPDAADP